MYAVIKTGGKQQRVKPGDVIEVERLVHEGETISFQPLLVVDDEGATHVGKAAAGAVVTAKPLGEKKGEKIRVLRYRPKTGYSKRTGHRQLLTLLEISGIELGSSAKRRSSKAAEPATSGPAEVEAAEAAPADGE
jgi:large subunit ribosomal protein L21